LAGADILKLTLDTRLEEVAEAQADGAAMSETLTINRSADPKTLVSQNAGDE